MHEVRNAYRLEACTTGMLSPYCPLPLASVASEQMRIPALAVDNTVDPNLAAPLFVENQIIAFDEKSVSGLTESAVARSGARVGKGLKCRQTPDDVANQFLGRVGLSSATKRRISSRSKAARRRTRTRCVTARPCAATRPGV